MTTKFVVAIDTSSFGYVKSSTTSYLRVVVYPTRQQLSNLFHSIINVLVPLAGVCLKAVENVTLNVVTESLRL